MRDDIPEFWYSALSQHRPGARDLAVQPGALARHAGGGGGPAQGAGGRHHRHEAAPGGLQILSLWRQGLTINNLMAEDEFKVVSGGLN